MFICPQEGWGGGWGGVGVGGSNTCLVLSSDLYRSSV